MQAYFEGMAGVSLIDIYFYATPIVKLVMTINFVAIIIAAIFALIQRSKGGTSGLLTALAFIGPILGLLAGVYAGFNIYVAAEATNTTDLRILAPSITEVIMVVVSGLLVWLIAVFGNSDKSRAQPSYLA